MTVSFFVAGVPAPQGSTRAFVVKGTTTRGYHAVVTHANRNTKDWRQRIATEAQKVGGGCTENPVEVSLRFVMPRPKSLPKKVVYHTKKPDLDKLVRACLDGVTGILIKDDSQVWALTATKRYAQESEPTGVGILIDDGVGE